MAAGTAVRSAFDLTLYLVVGSDAVGGRALTDVVSAAVKGGVTLVQLREKDAPFEQMVEQASALKALLAPLGVPLIVNDHLDVALAAEADGLHLGQDDGDPQAARNAIGPERILGLSAGDPEEAATVDPAIVDYAGIGPAYATGSKADAGEAIGLSGLRRLRACLDLPLVAIGGIDSDKAAAVMTTGVQGVAVVSAICATDDPEAAARKLRDAIEAGRP